MKKRNIILGSLIAAVAITSYSVSGTYAKYTSTVSVTDTARVAKWGIASANKTINLFSDSYTNAQSNADVTAANGNVAKIVAPGTSGIYAFDFNKDYAPETDYIVKFANNGSTDGTNGKIKYFVTKVANTAAVTNFDTLFPDGTTSYATVDALVAQMSTLSATPVEAGTVDTSVYVIGWKWDFEKMTDDGTGGTIADAATDTSDTNLGNATTLAQVVLNIKMIVEQYQD